MKIEDGNMYDDLHKTGALEIFYTLAKEAEPIEDENSPEFDLQLEYLVDLAIAMARDDQAAIDEELEAVGEATNHGRTRRREVMGHTAGRFRGPADGRTQAMRSKPARAGRDV